MMEILKERELVKVTSFMREFRYKDNQTGGFGFPCNSEGTVDFNSLNPAAQQNYLMCMAGRETKSGIEILDMGVEDYSHDYWEPAIGKCEVCGEEVQLDGFTCTCEKCGADYNSCGQRLGPRESWGEETGESVGDVLRIS